MNFKWKADVFDVFAAQCTLVQDNSKPPSISESEILQSLSPSDFTSNDIQKVIATLDHSKPNDMISIRMISTQTSKAYIQILSHEGKFSFSV